jgi:Zn-dependent M32 family carboxypeptidase
MKLFTFSKYVVLTSVLLAQSALPVAAQGISGNQAMKAAARLQNQASRAAERQDVNLQAIITRADELATNRITSLNTLLARVQNDNRLSESEKTSLTTEIKNDITGLTNLKAKIDADTDVETARTDAKQIVTNYYIYTVFEPKMRLLITLNNLQTVTKNTQLLVPEIQKLVATYKTQGKDVSQLETLLANVSTQLTTISTAIATDITKVEGVSTADKSTAQTTFTAVRQDIEQTIKADFAKLRSDLEQMRPLFKQLIQGTDTTATPSASITETETTISPTASH